MPTPRTLTTTLVLTLTVLGLAHLYCHAGYTLDDAYISFRYARNCARGLGLVYNPGEYVKGYSNTLLTLFMTLPELAGSDPKPWSKLLGVVAYAGLVWSAISLYSARGNRATPDRLAFLLALLAASTPVAVHFMNGLETGPYTALLFAAVVRRSHEQETDARPWSALLFTMAVVSRPEGIALFVVIAVHDAVWRLHARRLSARHLFFYIAPIAAYAGELLVSWRYYGDALPQTYYAKTRELGGLGAGLQQLMHAAVEQLHPASYFTNGLAQSGLGLWALLCIPLALAAREGRRRNSALACAVLAQFVFIVRAGDDWAPAFRFGVPLLPFLFALMLEAINFLAHLARRFERPVAWSLMALVAGVMLPSQIETSIEVNKQRFVNAEGKLLQGHLLAGFAPPGITLSSFDIGGQGYGAFGFAILDTGGLITREVADRSHHAQRASRYAALIMPELIRVHSSRKRDAFVINAVRKQHPYLELDAGKYWLRRDLVLGTSWPEGVVGLPPRSAGGATLVAHGVSPAVARNTELQVSLIWQRGVDAPRALEERRLEWLGTAVHFNANASEILWRHTPLESWSADETFVDFVTLRAPHRAGSYELQLVAGHERIVVARVEILADDALRDQARKLIAVAEPSDDTARRLKRLEWASLLSPQVVRSPYHSAVIAQAAASRAAADQKQSTDRVAALRMLQGAMQLLHRAYFLSGGATNGLRHEIDANASLRKRIIDAELVDL
jgi:arabinofuranosyltransferase